MTSSKTFMDIEIVGNKKLMNEMEKRFGKVAMKKKSEHALIAASDYLKSELAREFESFKDTGASIDEIHRGEPEIVGGQHRVLIYWDGPKDRYKIIHLNEHGYERNGKKVIPKGFGVIAKTLNRSQRKYQSIITEELKK